MKFMILLAISFGSLFAHAEIIEIASDRTVKFDLLPPMGDEAPSREELCYGIAIAINRAATNPVDGGDKVEAKVSADGHCEITNPYPFRN